MVVIFFYIFPSLNSGVKYNIYVTVASVILNIISIILWTKGEQNVANDNQLIEVPDPDNNPDEIPEEFKIVALD